MEVQVVPVGLHSDSWETCFNGRRLNWLLPEAGRRRHKDNHYDIYLADGGEGVTGWLGTTTFSVYEGQRLF